MTKKKNRKPGKVNSGPVVITVPAAHISINELAAAHDPAALAYLKGFDDCIHGRRSGFPDIPESSESRRLIIIAIQAKSFWRKRAAVIANAELERARRGPAAGKKRKAEQHAKIIEIWKTDIDNKGKHPSAARIFKHYPELKTTQDAIESVIQRHKKTFRQNDLS